MERRALIAILICFVILVAYQEVVRTVYPHPEEGPPSEQTVAAPPTARAERPAERAEEPAPEEAPEETVTEVEGRDIVLESDLYRAVFTTAGARLKSFQLHGYLTSVSADSPPLELLKSAPEGNLPLGVVLRGEKATYDDRAVLYEVDRDELRLSGTETGELVFRGRVGGSMVEKRIVASADRYFIGLQVQVTPGGDEPKQVAVTWREELGTNVWRDTIGVTSVLAIHDGKLRRYSPQCFFLDRMRGGCITLDEKQATEVAEEHVRWVAFDGRYFIAALIPETEPEDVAGLEIDYRNRLAAARLLLPPGALDGRFDLYVGPKKIEILESAPRSLRPALDLGMFTVVALPLLQVLRLSHRLTGNYGIDIILLTVIIKILFIPLTQKSLKSMREMQKLQPQMARIRERYKDKPEEMNREIMELYRRHKVNPLGGCLPMVLQIPVFIGLYQALLNAVELRHAPFVGWINDLSAPDRLGSVHLPFVEPPGFPVLTLLMGCSMFLQQWMTPSSGDPTQQRMMLFMPLIFTFMFINFPSGLTLYWLVNNVLTIAQQYTINRPDR